jgi:Rv2525c-like, glycoside hydrolase-like domain
VNRAVDHSTGGARIGAQLQTAGITGIFRYACAGRSDVNITPGEIADLRMHGVEVAVVNEHAAGYLLGGYSVGHLAALEGQEIARACGLPDGVVYLAGDSESLQDSNRTMALVGDACRGAGDAIGRENVGYYGSYPVIDYLARHYPWIRYYWQTAAWSGGRRHPLACAYQEPRQALFGNVQCDLDELLADDWGQRGYQPPPPPPTPEDTMAIAVAQNEDGKLECFVELASGEVKHIKQDATKLGWWQKDNGQPEWLSLGHPATK